MTKIKESKLQNLHEKIFKNLKANNLNPICEYNDGNKKENSIVSYTIEINQVAYYGFICLTDNKFQGAICDLRKIKQLTIEGFTDEQIGNEKIWIHVSSPIAFIEKIAEPVIENFKFSRDLVNECLAGNIL